MPHCQLMNPKTADLHFAVFSKAIVLQVEDFTLHETELLQKINLA